MAQLAIAWLAAQGEDIVLWSAPAAATGSPRPPGALRVTLTRDDLARIERAVAKHAAAGARHPVQAMADLDSEK